MTKKSSVREVEIEQAQAKNYKRMSLAASQYGLTIAYFKALINAGRLTRYKLGTATMIDCAELERLIVPDVGNHGRERAPKLSQG